VAGNVCDGDVPADVDGRADGRKLAAGDGAWVGENGWEEMGWEEKRLG